MVLADLRRNLIQPALLFFREHRKISAPFPNETRLIVIEKLLGVREQPIGSDQFSNHGANIFCVGTERAFHEGSSGGCISSKDIALNVEIPDDFLKLYCAELFWLQGEFLADKMNS